MSYHASIPLSGVEAAYRPRGHVRAADTDADGRRLGTPDDPEWNESDVLPKYDKCGGPPSYIESASTSFRLSVGCQSRQLPVNVPPCHVGHDTRDEQTASEPSSLADVPAIRVQEQLNTLDCGGLRPPPPAYHPP
ncbi:hypothetical protein J3A83DRAFT_4217531 [Scleroderma citrinum]